MTQLEEENARLLREEVCNFDNMGSYSVAMVLLSSLKSMVPFVFIVISFIVIILYYGFKDSFDWCVF